MTESILLIESDEKLRTFWQQALAKDGSAVVCAASREEALSEAKKQIPDLVFLGTGLQGEAALSLLREIQAINKGVMVIAPTQPQLLKDELQAISEIRKDRSSPIKVGGLRVAIHEAMEWKGLQAQGKEWLQAVREKYRFGDLMGESKTIADSIRSVLEIVQSKTTTVLITGETGTGKEVVARAIHENTPGRTGPFVVIPCTAFAENLLESELFGHVAGAFTDAKSDKMGLLEVANGGSLLLDEIGDMPLSLQAKLLGFLESKRFRRVGGTKDIEVSLRIIAATHKDLSEEVRSGRFRQDLYYRLKVFPVVLAPLRERPQDIIPLAHYFMDRFNRELNKKLLGLSFAAQRQLKNYPWPGNVRELTNVIERAVLLAKGQWISPEELVLTSRHQTSKTEELFRIPPEGLRLADMEKNLLRQTLQRTQGNQSLAAKLLGISRFALMHRIRKFDLKP